MTDQKTQAERLRSYHIQGNPLLLLNIWDAGTARIVADAGASAIATGSWAVAAANGYDDGEKIPLDLVLANLERIVSSVDLPVTFDLEGGYGSASASVAQTVSRALDAGAVGFNLEDQIIGENALYAITDQAARIAASRMAADKAGVPAFLNARTDAFLLAGENPDINALLGDVLQRAHAYHESGADGLFAPGLVDPVAIRALCDTAPLPVNIMMLPGCPKPEELRDLGVARISYGPGPYRAAMAGFAAVAKGLYS